MTIKNETKNSGDPAAAPRQRFRHSRKLGLVRSLMINVALIVLPLLIYFVVVMEHTSAYTDQRSLRALQEIATQIDNRLDTLKNILSLAPGELQRRIEEDMKKEEDLRKEDPKRGTSGKAMSLSDYLKGHGQHVAEMANDIPRVRVQRLWFVPSCNDAPGKCSGTKASDQKISESKTRLIVEACSPKENVASNSRLILDKEGSLNLRMIDCYAEVQDKTIRALLHQPVVETTFSEMIENTEALAELPLIMVASHRGEVYAQLIRNHAKDTNPPAHEQVREEPTLADLKEILAAAEKHAVNELSGNNEAAHTGDAKGSQATSLNDKQAVGGDKVGREPIVETDRVGLPVALDTHIAGTPYRAYVLPYSLKVPICKEADVSPDNKDGKDRCKVEPTIIYLVGLKRSGLVAGATGSLSPGLLLGALLVLISAGLLWPFLRYALLEPNDAVTWRQVRILCVAFLALTVLGVVSARGTELGYAMYEKMDHAVEVVAGDIDGQLHRRILSELGVLDRLENNRMNDPLPPGIKGAEPLAVQIPKNEVPEAYPIVEQFFRTDASGVSKKNRYTYDAIKETWAPLRDDINLSDRPYFYLLKDGYGVRDYTPYDETSERKPYLRNVPILLQRLFNKSDGKKILQLAFARNEKLGKFDGISAVNIGTIEVISPVLPLGIGYAIFERSTGTVVFHSDDSRSLVENLYAETEHNPTLSSAVNTEGARSTFFNGRYRGGNATFFYRQMTYSPWGLVVFYDSSGVSAVVALVVVSALAATVVTLMSGLVLAHAVARVARRRHSWLWPQWRLRNTYATVTAYLVLVAFCEFQILRWAQSDAWQFVVLLTAPLLVLTACFSALSARTPEITVGRPKTFRHGLNLVQWSLLLHGVLVIAWALAAAQSGQYWSCVALVLSFLIWFLLLDRSVEGENVNPWRRDLSLWPSTVMPVSGRVSYRMRYLLFVVSLALVVSAVPTLAIFDRTFEWYLSSALNVARAGTNDQWEARLQRTRKDVSGSVQSAELGLQGARELGGFGVASVATDKFDVDGEHLFKLGPPTSCFDPPVVWPLGMWERRMHWGQGLLERLRQEALASSMPDTVQANGGYPVAKCGVRGTIHELLHAGDKSWTPLLWDIVAVLAVLALLMLQLIFIVRHVTGISMPWSGRFGRQKAPVPAPDATTAEYAHVAPRHTLLLQPNEESIAYVRACNSGDVREIDVAADRLDFLKPRYGKETTWLLRRVDIAVLDEDRRATLLGLLETLVADLGTRVVAVGDVSPVYRIARPQAYPGPSWPHIDDHERLRWIDLFTRFHKAYSVEDIKAIFEPTNRGAGSDRTPDDLRRWELDELIHRETRALWPCLRPIRDGLLDRLHAGDDMTDRDVIEVVALHGEIHYRKAWEYCTREERLALHHLAQGKLFNMSNHRVVEHLLRRGLVVLEPEPRIKSISLAEFVLNAELPGRMEAWAAEAAEGLWQSVRVPFFVALMLVVAWIAYSSGDAFQAVVALVATSVAVIGQAVRLLGMVGFSSPIKDK
jgi:hypothetical protein